MLSISSAEVFGSPAPGPQPQWSELLSYLPPTVKQFVQDTVMEGAEVMDELADKAEDIFTDLYEDVIVEGQEMVENLYEDVMEEVMENQIDVAKYVSLAEQLFGDQ